jgi:hypothetical protein
MNFSNVFFDVESESEVSFYLTITVLALDRAQKLNAYKVTKPNILAKIHHKNEA